MDRFSYAKHLHGGGKTILIGKNDGFKEIPLLIEKDFDEFLKLDKVNDYDCIIINKVLENKQLLKENKTTIKKVIDKSTQLLKRNGRLIIFLFISYEWDDEMDKMKSEVKSDMNKPQIIDLLTDYTPRFLHKTNPLMNSGEVYWYVLGIKR